MTLTLTLRGGLLALGVALLSACGGSAQDDSVQVRSVAMVEGLSCTGANASGWCWQQPQPNGNEARDGVFVDALRGWMVGDQGLVLHTVDGGKTWARQAVPTIADLHRVAFRDARNGVAVAAGGAFLATQDGGASWALRGTAPVANPLRIWLRPGNVVVVTGTDVAGEQRSAISRDGGNGWGTIALPRQVDYNAIDFDGVLWAAYQDLAFGDYGAGAATPRPAQWPAGAALQWIDVQDDGFAWALLGSPTDNGSLLAQRTAPGGAWAVRPLQLPANDAGYRVSNGKLMADGRGLVRAYVSGQPFDTRYARTLDGGASWTWVPLPGSGLSLVDELILVDGRTLWGRFTDAGGAKKLLISTDGGDHWFTAFPQVAQEGYYTLNILRDASGGLLVHAKSAVRQWFRSVDNGASWAELPAGSGPDEATAGLWFAATGRGLRMTASGTLFDTADQGRHWLARAAPLGSWVRSVRIAANGHGWAVADGVLSKTLDGGRSWTAIHPAELANNYLSSYTPVAVLWTDGPRLRVEAEFRCPRPGMCGRALFSSDDAGLTWSSTPGFARGAEPGFAGPDVVVGVLGGALQRSADRGNTWAVVSTLATAGAARVVFQDANNAWVVGSDTIAWHSRDAGLSWSPVALPTPVKANPYGFAVFRDIAFADALHGWMVGDGGAVLATRDGGATWVRQASGTSRDLNKIWVDSASRVWIAGAGVVLATVTGGQPDP